MRERNDLRWNGLALHFGRHTKPLSTVVPDDRWPGMWRIRHHDGILSDLLNLTRARDAATSIALAYLNYPKGKKPGQRARPCVFRVMGYPT